MGGLDADLAAVEAALQEHQAAYKAVLAFGQQAQALPERKAALQRLQEARALALTALGEMEDRLRSMRAQFDPVEYAGILAEDQSLRGETAGLRARQTLLEQEQTRAKSEINGLRALQANLEQLSAEQGKLGRHGDVLETVTVTPPPERPLHYAGFDPPNQRGGQPGFWRVDAGFQPRALLE